MRQIWAMDSLELLGEIALLQWDIAVETAQAARIGDDAAIAAAVRRLETSESDLDRYAGQLARRWERM